MKYRDNLSNTKSPVVKSIQHLISIWNNLVGEEPIIKGEEMNSMNEKINELIEYPKKGILSKDIVKNNKLNITLFCMSKGTEMSDHTSTKQGFVYVIEGNGTFNLEGKEIAMSPGVFIYMRENAIHSLKANENTSFILVLTNT